MKANTSAMDLFILIVASPDIGEDESKGNLICTAIPLRVEGNSTLIRLYESIN